MTREQAKQVVYDRFRQELRPDKSRKGYICPLCGSGSGAKGTGITENPRSPGHYSCWAGCFKNADAFDIIAMEENLPAGSGEAMQAAYRRYNIEIDRTGGHQRPQERAKPAGSVNTQATEKPPQSAPQPDYMDKIKAAREAFPGSPAEQYINRRGISTETASRFWLGYSPAEYFPGDGNHPALIIPAGNSFYTARNLEAGARYSNPKGAHAILFNGKAISNQQGEPVFLVEGAVDALSIIEAGGEAVALNSASNPDLFIAKIKDAKQLPPFILCLDPDKAGNGAAEKIKEALQQIGAKHIDGKAILCGEHDPNDALIKDRAAFLEAVEAAKRAALNIAQAEAAEYQAESAAGYMVDFWAGIKKNAENPAIETGFANLDEAFDGGLYPGLYFIGAISSLGKTTFCLQIADQIAAAGNDVLIFSLEMAREELIAKSVSRLTFQRAREQGMDSRNAKTTRGIMDGKRWGYYNETESSLIASSITEYSDMIAPHVWIVQGIGDIGAQEVRERVSKHISLTGRKPFVLIDYVQILAPYDVRASDKQNTDKAVLELKRISRDFNIAIMGISSLNRESYTEPISMRAFKESGAIEYGSDILLGLQYSGMDYQDGEKDPARIKRVRTLMKEAEQRAANGGGVDIQLKILKNRNGRKGLSLGMTFFPMFNCFVSRSPGEFVELDDEPTPFDDDEL